ncbi:MAG TPA: hypothetical protein PK002_07995 [Cellvibrio sp.]|nr:hypothetical protein [Cellvibrio sp.]
MSPTRTLLLGIAGLVAGWFLTSLLFSSIHSEPENSNHSQSNHAQSDKETQYETAKKHDASTSQHLHTNKKDTPRAAEQFSATASTNTIAPKTEPNNISENLQNANIPQVPFTSTLAGMFYTEPTDEQWASETKLILENQMSVDAPLRGAEIKSVECKSTTCKVITVIHSKDARQFDKILHELMRDISMKQREYLEPNIMSVRERDNTISIYVQRIQRKDP